MTQRTRACLLPGIVASLLCAAGAPGQGTAPAKPKPAAQPADKPAAQGTKPKANKPKQPPRIVSEVVNTGDGSRFLLVPTAAAPVIHWITAIPAGDLIDPPEHPGLSHAIARSTLSGSDSVGTANWAEEHKAQTQLDALMRDVTMMLASGQMPTEEMARKVTQLKGRIDRLQEPRGWERQLRAAPSTEFEVREFPNAVVTGVTTTRTGVATVARLLMDRRENSILRDLQAQYNALLAERAGRSATDSERVREEIIDLAFYGARARISVTVPTVDKERAREIYRKMYSPAATFQVITGGFDLAEMRRFLQRQFTQTSLPMWVPPTRDIRRDSKMRVSTLSNGSRRGIAIGIRTDASITANQLRVLGEWFGGGPTSMLARQFSRAGIVGVECRATAPFPPGANPGVLLIEAWTSPEPRLATDADLLEPLRRALAESVNRISYPDVDRARTRAMGARNRERFDPRHLAFWLALECGMHGRPIPEALDVDVVDIRFDLFKGFADEVLGRGQRTIVYMETTE